MPWLQSVLVNIYKITECPKMYRKTVLHLLKHTVNLHLNMQYKFAVSFETLSKTL